MPEYYKKIVPTLISISQSVNAEHVMVELTNKRMNQESGIDKQGKGQSLLKSDPKLGAVIAYF